MSVFIPIPKKGNAKECSNYCTIVLISDVSRVMIKILQARLQQHMNCELPVFKLDLEKAEEPEIKLPTPDGSSKKHESSRKISSSSLLTTQKPLTVWITTNYEKFLKRWQYQTTCKIRIQVRKQQLELDVEQHTGSKLESEYIKAVYCHPAYLTYMQTTSCEMPGWMKHKLDSSLLEQTSITSDI